VCAVGTIGGSADRFSTFTADERRLIAETLRGSAEGDAELLALADEAQPLSAWGCGYAAALHDLAVRNRSGPTAEAFLPWLSQAMAAPEAAARSAEARRT